MTTDSTLNNLIREGVVVLYHDYRRGDCLDRGSLRLNNGVQSAGCKWSGRALKLQPTDIISVADSASLRLSTGSIILLSRSITPLGTYEVQVYHKSGGNGFQWYSQPSVNAHVWEGDAGVADSVVWVTRGLRTIGLTFVSGAHPIPYGDGVRASVSFAGALAPVTATVAETRVAGNSTYSFGSSLEAVVMVNRVLTATEMAAVHSDLVNLKWPSRYVSLAKRVQGSQIGEPTLKAGYTLKPVGASVASHDGAFTGTISGQASSRESILGPALELGRVTGAVDLGIGNATINPTTDSHWVEVWARPVDAPRVDVCAPLIGKAVTGSWSVPSNFGVIDAGSLILYWVNMVPAIVQVNGPPSQNKLTHVLYQVDRVTNNAYLYVDGVQYGPTAITTVYTVMATNWVVGKCGSTQVNLDEGFGGLVVNPRIGLGVLTAAQVQARYLEGAKAIQFKTGYGFQVSPVREGGVLDQQIGGTLSPFRAGDTTGRWLIETDTIEGKSCKVLTCSTAGSLYIPASYFGDSTPTENAFGTWDFWVRRIAGGVTRGSFICPSTGVGAAPANGYRWQMDDAATYLVENAIGAMITVGVVTASVWHRVRVTRSITGLFTFYIDNLSVGTATDVTTLTSLFFNLDIDAGDKIALGDSLGGHGLVKMLGVVTPTEGP